MTEIVRRLAWDRQQPLDADALLTHEWLVTNGLGGSASGTVAGVATRRFHGLLVAALPAPLGRIVMLNHLAEQLRLPDGRADRAWRQRVRRRGAVPAGSSAPGRVSTGAWPARSGATRPRGTRSRSASSCRTARTRSTSPIGCWPARARPDWSFGRRSTSDAHEGRVDQPIAEPYVVTAVGNRYEIGGPPELPPLRLTIHGAPAVLELDGGITSDAALPRRGRARVRRARPALEPGSVLGGPGPPGQPPPPARCA